MSTRSRAAAVASVLLALPFATLFTLLVLGIEPPLGPLEPLFAIDDDEPQILGSAVVLGAWLLSVVAFNAVLAVVIALFVVMFVGAIIVDQYPCWIGVPNCD